MTVYTTLLSRGRERVSHFGTSIDLSSLPLVKKVNKKVKSRTVSWVNRCRAVCLSVFLAIKTPHTPVEKSLIFKKERGSLFTSGF